MTNDRIERTITTVRLSLLCVSLLVIPLILMCATGGHDDAYVLVRDDHAEAQWHYQQLPMRECRWCGRRVNLNRHHVIPQAANPALRDVRENLVVLCRECHFVLGHRCDWHTYNPDVLQIVCCFTNRISSSDTRRGLENPTQERAE